MGLPEFLLRKLYEKGTLRETGKGRFAFNLHNVLGPATVTAPPQITVNGIHYGPDQVETHSVEFAKISKGRPFLFKKGDRATLRFAGHLLRGGNRIHLVIQTKEFGELQIHVEDKEADAADMPGGVHEAE